MMVIVPGRSVFYKSTGSSMWPLVQSEDACTFHPIQAVTAKGGGKSRSRRRLPRSRLGTSSFAKCSPASGSTPTSSTKSSGSTSPSAEVLDREHSGAHQRLVLQGAHLRHPRCFPGVFEWAVLLAPASEGKALEQHGTRRCALSVVFALGPHLSRNSFIFRMGCQETIFLRRKMTVYWVF